MYGLIQPVYVSASKVSDAPIESVVKNSPQGEKAQ